MDGDMKVFVLLIVGISTLGWIINNWIRARHGYPLEDEWGGKTEPNGGGDSQRLQAENRELHQKLDAMQDRMIVLEKIVTDKGYSLAEEIEALRDTPSASASADTGVPLNFNTKEKA